MKIKVIINNDEYCVFTDVLSVENYNGTLVIFGLKQRYIPPNSSTGPAGFNEKIPIGMFQEWQCWYFMDENES